MKALCAGEALHAVCAGQPRVHRHAPGAGDHAGHVGRAALQILLPPGREGERSIMSHQS